MLNFQKKIKYNVCSPIHYIHMCVCIKMSKLELDRHSNQNKGKILIIPHFFFHWNLPYWSPFLKICLYRKLENIIRFDLRFNMYNTNSFLKWWHSISTDWWRNQLYNLFFLMNKLKGIEINRVEEEKFIEWL